MVSIFNHILSSFDIIKILSNQSEMYIFTSFAIIPAQNTVTSHRNKLTSDFTAKFNVLNHKHCEVNIMINAQNTLDILWIFSWTI